MSDYSLKRHFDGGCARMLADTIPELHGQREEFAAAVDAVVGPMELKDRVLVLARELRERLPASYPQAVGILVDSLGPELAEGEGMFTTSWYLMPVARFVEEFGLDYPEVSLTAIREITRRHTGEYAIRPYLVQHHDLTMAHVRAWSTEESLNVRRLASEGIRPRLPWAASFDPFIRDPGPVIEILDRMTDDPSPYVRKSVANNLNDIARDNRDLAVETARRWVSVGGESERTRWIVNHGMRSLVKKGDPDALDVVGSGADPDISVQNTTLAPTKAELGGGVEIRAQVRNGSDATRSIVVDYNLVRQGARGRSSVRTYKLTKLVLKPGESASVVKVHRLRVTSTRPLHEGRYTVTVQANGAAGEPVELQVHEP